MHTVLRRCPCSARSGGFELDADARQADEQLVGLGTDTTAAYSGPAQGAKTPRVLDTISGIWPGAGRILTLISLGGGGGMPVSSQRGCGPVDEVSDRAGLRSQ
jgi:hypothetical protein